MVGSLVRFLLPHCEESQAHSFAVLTCLFVILHNSWIKIVRAHQPWSNLYILSARENPKIEGRFYTSGLEMKNKLQKKKC